MAFLLTCAGKAANNILRGICTWPDIGHYLPVLNNNKIQVEGVNLPIA